MEYAAEFASIIEAQHEIIQILTVIASNQAVFMGEPFTLILLCVGVVSGAVIGNSFVSQWRLGI